MHSLQLAIDDPQPPEDVYVHHRWIAPQRVAWAQQCNEILEAYGAVRGSRVYPAKHFARYRAESLIRLLVELRLHERWELRQHVDRWQGGYVWSVEYVRSPADGRSRTSSPAYGRPAYR